MGRKSLFGWGGYLEAALSNLERGWHRLVSSWARPLGVLCLMMVIVGFLVSLIRWWMCFDGSFEAYLRSGMTRWEALAVSGGLIALPPLMLLGLVLPRLIACLKGMVRGTNFWRHLIGVLWWLAVVLAFLGIGLTAAIV